MPIIAILKRKGGVGSSTLAANLPRTRLGRELPAALAGIGESARAAVLPSISQRIAVAESVLSGLTVNEYEPDGPAAKEFAELADAVEGLL